MKAIRIEPVIKDGQIVLLIDIQCDCGNNGLISSQTGKGEFKQPVIMGKSVPNITLSCKRHGCRKKYVLVSQGNHLHIRSKG